jgi:hypothetical protein
MPTVAVAMASVATRILVELAARLIASAFDLFGGMVCHIHSFGQRRWAETEAKGTNEDERND